MEKKFERVCEVCGEEFFSSITYGRCCSDKCRTRRWRLTEKGKECIVRSNSRHKRVGIEKVCIHCKKKFITTRRTQGLCRQCSKEHGPYYAQLNHRAKYPHKNRIRDRTNKRKDERRTSKKNLLQALPCEICGDEKSEAHHFNYDNPLNINWLCKKHHTETHKAQNRD